MIGGLAITAPPARATISLTPITTGFNGMIGIDHHEPTNQVIVSVNYPDGLPYNFELVAADGTRSQFSPISGFTDEVKIGAVREGPCQRGFTAGEVFTGTGVGGVVARISPDGTSVLNPWVTLPGETGPMRGSLFQDRYCVFGGDLLVVTSAGGVWRVTSAGTATRLADINVGWGSPTYIETNNAGGADVPQVAFDPAGNAIAVWYGFDGSTLSVWSSRFVRGVGWGTPQLIESSSDLAQVVRLAVDGEGNAIAVWTQFGGGLFHVWGNRYVAGVGWGAAGPIERKDVGDARYPQITMNRAGVTFVSWILHEGPRENLWVSRFVPGTGWEEPSRVETNDAGDVWNHDVAVDPGGNAIVVWTHSDGTREDVWANRYVAGTGWGTPQVLDANSCGTSTPKVAVDSAGRGMAVWFECDGVRDNVVASRFEPGTGWSAPQGVESMDQSARLPEVGVDGAGTVLVVWAELSTTEVGIWGNRYVPGIGWGTPERIGSRGTEFPQLAVNPDGVGFATWDFWNWEEQTFSVAASRYVPGVGWETEHFLETDSGVAVRPHAAVDAAGNAMALWTQFDGIAMSIRASEYDASPVHLDGLTTVPDDPAKYGPWARKILAGAEQQGCVYAIDTAGNAQCWRLGINPEDIDIIPANENFFGVDYGSQILWGAPSSEFSAMVGDILVTQEFPGQLFHVRWDAGTQTFVSVLVAEVAQWEHVTFSKAGIQEIPGVGNECPLSHGFWKNHPEDWPTDSLALGGATYNESELLALLRAPSKGDATIILARQLIAAKLNVANGSDPAPIASNLTEADALLGGLPGKLPYGVKPSSPIGQQMTALAEVLDDFNNGLLIPNCACDDDDDDEEDDEDDDENRHGGRGGHSDDEDDECDNEDDDDDQDDEDEDDDEEGRDDDEGDTPPDRRTLPTRIPSNRAAVLLPILSGSTLLAGLAILYRRSRK